MALTFQIFLLCQGLLLPTVDITLWLTGFFLIFSHLIVLDTKSLHELGCLCV
jgi:hypothetical protein